MMSLESGITTVPAILQSKLQHFITVYREQAKRAQLQRLAHSKHEADLLHLWAVSEFVAEQCVREPALLDDLIVSGDLDSSYPQNIYQDRLITETDSVTDEYYQEIASLRAKGQSNREIIDWIRRTYDRSNPSQDIKRAIKRHGTGQ